MSSIVPTEIWSHVVQYLPRNDQTTLLEVSHLFHDIALDLVFAAVKLHFMGGNEAYRMLCTENEEFVEDTSYKLVTRSWEILRRITNDPGFARAVKSITIIAFTDGMAIFEKLCLMDALDALQHLQTFRWCGNLPPLTDEVAGHIPASTKSLFLQTCVPSAATMQRFTNIHRLAFTTPFLYPDDEEAHDHCVLDEYLFSAIDDVHFTSLLSSMTLDTLESLTLDGRCLSGMPIRILSNLKDLTICFTMESEQQGLDLIFRHAIQLESLTLVGLLGSDLFPALVTDPDSSVLPSLHSLRISCDNYGMGDTPEPQWVDVLFRFIWERKGLRRLYLRIPRLDFRLAHSISHLDLLSNLKHLQVLGLHTGLTDVDMPFLRDLCACLPRALRAIHLGMDWNTSEPLLDLVDFLATFPNITFAHFYGAMHRLPILLIDLATEVPTLQMVGLNRALWDVDRSGPELELKKWPRWKIKFCTEEDFASEDEFWLFQYN